jgi:hypothetical protein
MKRERQDLSTDDRNWYCYIPLTTNDGRPRSRESVHVIDIYIRCCSQGINAKSEEKRDPIPHRYTWIYICMTAADLYRRKRIRTTQNMMIYAADKLGRVYTHTATSPACIIFIRCWLLPKFSVKRFSCWWWWRLLFIVYSVDHHTAAAASERLVWLYIHCRWNILPTGHWVTGWWLCFINKSLLCWISPSKKIRKKRGC